MRAPTTTELTIAELLDQHERLKSELHDADIDITEAFPRGAAFWKLCNRKARILEAKKDILNELLAR